MLNCDSCFILFAYWGVGVKGENGASPLHFAARFHLDKCDEIIPEETPKLSKKQFEGSISEKHLSAYVPQKTYLKASNVGAKKRDMGIVMKDSNY